MNKERELLFNIVETWGNAAISSAQREQWLKDYAAQQAITFAEYSDEKCWFDSEYKLWYTHDEAADPFRFTTQELYNQFIEQQNKE